MNETPQQATASIEKDGTRDSSWLRMALMFTLLGLALRLFHLDYRGLWEDEFLTLRAITLPWGEMCRERLQGGHFPTYFALLKAWTMLAGLSDAALRMPSVILSALAIPFYYAFARRGFGARVAFWATLFFVVQQRMVWAGQEARPYALLMLSAAASSHALLCAFEGNRARWWFAYGAWSLLGILGHGTYPFLLAAQVLAAFGWMTHERRWRWGWGASMLSVGVIAAAGYRLIMALRTNTRITDDPEWLGMKRILDVFADMPWGEYDVLFGASMRYVLALLFFAGLALAWRGASKRDGGQRPFAWWLALAWALALPVGLFLLSGTLTRVAQYSRYYALSAGGALLVLALAGVSLKTLKRQRVWLGVCLMLMLAITFSWYGFRRDALRETFAQLNREQAPGELAIFLSPHDFEVAVDHYGYRGDWRTINPRQTDKAMIRSVVERWLAGQESFWLIYCQERSHTLDKIERDWIAERYQLQHEWEDAKIRGRYYARD